MIDCSRCRQLIDQDLANPLDSRDRIALANHLRTCSACVTYRKDRLQDSSILRRSVDELKEKAETPPPPPPPVAHRSFWPWVVTAAILIAAAFGVLSFLERPSGDAGPTGPPGPSLRPGPGTTGAARSGPTPGPSTGPSPAVPPVTPPSTTPELLRVAGTVLGPDGQPAGGARLAVVRSPDPSADCTLAEAGTDGAFRIELQGAPPLFITAWTDSAISNPVPVAGRTDSLRVELGPGRLLTGTVQGEAGLDPNGRRVLAVWGEVGRAVSTPVRAGSFALTVPLERSVELYPFREGTNTFEWVPPSPLNLGSGHRDPLLLRAAPSHLVLVRLHEAGRTIERKPRVIAAWQEGEGSVRFLSPVPGVPGTYHTSLPPGSFRVLVCLPGYREVLQEITVAELLLVPIALEPSPFSLQGFLSVSGPEAAWPGSVTVRRDPPGRPETPGLQVPVVRENGRAAFQVDQVPWSRVVVEAGTPLAIQSEPIPLPRSGFEIMASFDASVRGVVRDAAGRPLPAVPITVQAPGGRRHTLTDAEGRYRMDRLPAGALYAYPQTLALRWESAPLARNEYRLSLAPSVTAEKDFVLPGAAPVRVRVRDEEGRGVQGTVMIRTPGGVLVQAREANPADPDPARDAMPVLLSPVVPGTYRIDVQESGVLYPLGVFQLPGDVDVTVRRRQGRLVLQPVWRASDPAPQTPFRLTIRRRHGEATCRLELPPPLAAGSLEIGGLESGAYEVTAEHDGRFARGLASVGLPGNPAERITLAFR